MNTTLAFLPHGADWIWILAIVILLFGAKKLPELFHGLGRSVGEFKRGKEEAEKGLNEPPTVVDTSRHPNPDDTKKS